MAKILVTGGTGFIGSHLVRGLIARGHEVTCTVRPRSNTRWVEKYNPLYKYDLESLDHYDTLYHIAGILGNPLVSHSSYWRVHVDMTRQLIEAMNPDARFVYMSSAWVLDPKEPYEMTKLEGEKVVRGLCKNYSIIRPGFVYGPRDMHMLPLFRWVKRLGIFFPIVGSGRNLVCPTYVGDVVEVLIQAPEGETTVAGIPITMEGFIKKLAFWTGNGRPRIHIPAVIKQDFFTKQRVFVSSKGSMSLDDGLERTVSWYRAYHYL